MADHAVGGVHCLVDGAARKSGNAEPEGRRYDAVREVFGQALDSRPRHTGFVELVRVASHDARNSRAPRSKPASFQRVRYGGDVIAKASLRKQAACRCGRQQDAERDERKYGGHGQGDQGCDADKDSERQNAGLPTAVGTVRRPVERPIEPRNQSADPDHRMADCLQQRLGIAGRTLYEQCEEGDQD